RRSVLQQQQQQPLSEVAPGQSEELLETPTKAKQQRTGRRQSVAKAKSKPMKGKNKSIAEIDDEQLEKENATSVELKQLLQSAISERDDVSLVGRQAELETLETFLRGKASHSVLYVCGAPGSGKTAAVKTAVRKLQSVKAVRCILHNCMETGESAKSFSAQLAQLVDAKNSSANSGGDGGAGSLKLAEAAIRRFLQQQQQQSLSLVLDEIDQIDLANLRRIFRWPDSLAGAGDGNRLRVLGVANSLSLCDRLFPASA
uniref:AAA domain-containing protein n=1 Tax=Macrostomum lignano TaxID=282301 RepID=A0A1I8JFN8_9PLAT